MVDDFSKFPAGRFKKDDPKNSGETFREEFLQPLLNDQSIDKLIVDLDGLPGVGSFFWDEAFGGMIRNGEVSYETVKNKLELRCTENISTVKRIEKYMLDEFKKLPK